MKKQNKLGYCFYFHFVIFAINLVNSSFTSDVFHIRAA